MKTGKLEITNEDCMELMKRYPDKYFQLAIVDPPYGIGDSTLTSGGTWANKYKKGDASWDVAPTQEYFIELMRVSVNQIIWGGNYFSLPASRCFLIWDKVAHMDTLSDCEYAWTSFDKNAKIFKHIRNTSEKRIHITQKPIKLYEWLLKNYAKEGDKILDTHLGSGSSAIACYYAGHDLTACELDKEYYDMAMERIKTQTLQIKLM